MSSSQFMGSQAILLWATPKHVAIPKTLQSGDTHRAPNVGQSDDHSHATPGKALKISLWLEYVYLFACLQPMNGQPAAWLRPKVPR